MAYRFNELDFQVFQVQLLCSLSPSTPLDLNLRAVMAPLLHRLMRYTGAKVGAHIFVNQAMSEVHVLTLGVNPVADAALDRELARRHRPVSFSESPDAKLPAYANCQIGTTAIVRLAAGPGVVKPITGQLLSFLQAIAPNRIGQGQDHGHVITLPLQFASFQRLGMFLLWAPGTDLHDWHNLPESRDVLATLRSAVQIVMVRLFSNFYQMGPDTYLPSYYQCRPKPVDPML